MRFEIRKKKETTAERLHLWATLAMCLSVFAVYLMTSFGGDAVPASHTLGELYQSYITESPFYELLGLPEVEEGKESEGDSVYTALPAVASSGDTYV